MFHRKFNKNQLQGIFAVILFLGFAGMFVSSTLALIHHETAATGTSGFSRGASSVLGSFVFSGVVCGLFIHSFIRKLWPSDPEAQAERAEARFMKAWQKAAKQADRQPDDRR